MFFGVGNHHDALKRKLALEHGAAIIFIDELDAIGLRRSGTMGTSTMSSSSGPWPAQRAPPSMDPPNMEYRLWAKILRRFGLRPKPGPQPVVLTIGATTCRRP